jgi:hypothetical protein
MNDKFLDAGIKGRKILGAGKKVFKKVPAGYKITGAVIVKGAKLAAMNPVKAIGAAVLGTASNRRYAKAPKPGEGRDLRNIILSKGLK